MRSRLGGCWRSATSIHASIMRLASSSAHGQSNYNTEGWPVGQVDTASPASIKSDSPEGDTEVPHSVASPWAEQSLYCAWGCAWTRSSGFRCKVLPAATYTFLSNWVRPGARTSMS